MSKARWESNPPSPPPLPYFLTSPPIRSLRSLLGLASLASLRSPQALGPSRVWLAKSLLPGLNMSRSLGDLIGKQAGVISLPHAQVELLTPTDRVLVLASDGLWDFVSNEDVAAVALSTADCWEAAAALARLTRARWLVRTGGADDTTVVIVRLGAATVGRGA